MDFWYEFDLLFSPGFGRVPSDILEAEPVTSALLFEWLAARNNLNIKNYPENFISLVTRTEETKNAIMLLANNQLRVIGEKLDYNIQLQKAFQYFGQGVLFDDSID